MLYHSFLNFVWSSPKYKMLSFTAILLKHNNPIDILMKPPPTNEVEIKQYLDNINKLESSALLVDGSMQGLHGMGGVVA